VHRVSVGFTLERAPAGRFPFVVRLGAASSGGRPLYLLITAHRGWKMRTETGSPETLRQQAWEIGRAIERDPKAWRPAADWLRELSVGDAVAFVGTNGKKGRFGPVAWRLREAWKFYVERFYHARRRDADRFFDLCREDAMRIALLAACTFHRDFPGRLVNLEWDWEGSSARADGIMEGRAWACSIVQTMIAEERLTELVGKAINELRLSSDSAPDDRTCASDGLLSSKAIATRFGLPAEALRKRLDRWRKQNPDHPGWTEVSNPRSHQSTYLYSLAAVGEIVDALRASGNRPTKFIGSS